MGCGELALLGVYVGLGRMFATAAWQLVRLLLLTVGVTFGVLMFISAWLTLGLAPPDGVVPSSAHVTLATVKIERCVRSWGEARYRGYGYDHVVNVANDCDKPISCQISTDVDPKPQSATIPSGRQVQVITRRGSPSRRFVPRVVCAFIK